MRTLLLIFALTMASCSSIFVDEPNKDFSDSKHRESAEATKDMLRRANIQNNVIEVNLDEYRKKEE